MDPALKPCPFCGGKAGFDQRHLPFHTATYEAVIEPSQPQEKGVNDA